MTDRFGELKIFVAVVQAKRFGLAADRLGIAKSAASRRVQELESRLGVTLLNRTTRRLSLTEAGTEFYQRALRLLADLEEAETSASKGTVDPSGRLRITGPMSFGILHLAPVIGEFLAQHPKLQVDLHLDDRVVDLVDAGYDLAIRVGDLKESNLIARRIAPVHYAAVAAPSYLRRRGTPKTPTALDQHWGLAYSNRDEASYWRFVDPESKAALTASVHTCLRINNGDALREAALAGYGIAVLPTFITWKAVERGELRALLQEYRREPVNMHAVYPSRRNLPAKVRVFIDFLVGRFGNSPYWDAPFEKRTRAAR